MGSNKGGISEAGTSGQTGTSKAKAEDQCRWQARHFGGYETPLGAQTSRGCEGAASGRQGCKTKVRCQETCEKGSGEEDCRQGHRAGRHVGSCCSVGGALRVSGRRKQGFRRSENVVATRLNRARAASRATLRENHTAPCCPKTSRKRVCGKHDSKSGSSRIRPRSITGECESLFLSIQESLSVNSFGLSGSL